MSPLLRLYLAFSTVSRPVWRLIHKRRLAQGKEIAARLPEKYAHYTAAPAQPTVLWFHALSIGESFALLPLIERALRELPEAEAVLTTSTASSVEALAKADLPDRCRHLLLPIDTRAATRGFLAHWRPALACFAELDFWPRLMVETHRRGVPMILANSRMPDGNYARRQRLGRMMRDILHLFDRLLVQDALSRDRFVELGADPERIAVVGALKAAARPLAADEETLSTLQGAIGSRPVWCAAATERSEHPAMIEAHRTVIDACPDALLIVAPRFREDGDELEERARAAFSKVARRSRADSLEPDTQVYIADTFGEMGLWYRLTPVSFVGHSLTEGLEGKNPFEAAALGSAILTGPHMSYFAESYDALIDAGACEVVQDASELAAAIIRLRDLKHLGAMQHAARQVIAERRGVLDQTWDVLCAYL
ncbi:MAG: glycosyltransferase N-terminal domain-containing protein [Pseudomonadota bacterium]